MSIKKKIHFLRNERISKILFANEKKEYARKIEQEIMQYYADTQNFLLGALNVKNRIIEFLIDNPDLTIVVDLYREFGAVQDEFNDPRYSDSERKKKNLLTGQAVGRNIDIKDRNIFIGKNI